MSPASDNASVAAAKLAIDSTADNRFYSPVVVTAEYYRTFTLPNGNT
jgi:hypothetical protein